MKEKYRVPYELMIQEPEQWGGAFLWLAGKSATDGVAGLVLWLSLKLPGLLSPSCGTLGRSFQEGSDDRLSHICIFFF